MKSILGLFLVAMTLQLPGVRAADAPVARGWSMRDLALVPMQNGGRLKPLDSFARETALFITGARSFQGYAPLELLLAWIASPDDWRKIPVIKVNREDVRRQLGLDEKRSMYAPDELLHNFAFIQYAQEGAGRTTPPPQPGGQAAPRPSEREEEVRRVMDRLMLFQTLVSGDAWLLIPRAQPADPWLSLRSDGSEGTTIRTTFLAALKAYMASDADAFAHAAREVRAAVEGGIPDFEKRTQGTIAAEELYNRAHPFQLAWILYLLTALTLMVSGAIPRLKTVGMVAMFGGFACHVVGFGLRCYIAGRPPVTNMYESVIWVSLGVVVFAAILYAIQRNAVALTVAAALSTLGLILADAAPAMLDPSIRPLVPVLRSNYWLTIHVLTITLGYAALALTGGLANVTLFQSLRTDPAARQRLAGMNLLTYRSMQFGVVLLAAGTILGGVWADASWGRFWGWDPKEVWALIALMAYVIILHGRYAGWVGQFAFSVCTVIAFMTVLMAWYGVNFILGKGLHSYGFSSGGFFGVMTYVTLQLAYVGTILALRGRGARSGAPVPA